MNEFEELRRRIAELEHSETDRKRAWETLQASEVWYRTLAENLPGIVYRVYIRESNRMRFFNNMLPTMTGYKVEELEVSQVCSFESLIVPEDRADIMATVKNAIKEDKPFEIEYRLKHKDGDIRYFFERGRPIRGTDGKPLHIDGVILDITERKRAEQALRLAHTDLSIKARDLEAANDELSRYDHVVAHVLKAPLRAIHNYSDFLREELEATLKGNQKVYIDSLNAAVHQCAKLLDDLLEFSVVGRRRGPSETIDIGVFLQGVIASLDLSPDVEVVMGNDWPTIYTEPTLLRQIFVHLIRNAIKFNHSPRKRVELGWLPIGNEHYELFVRDNGIGLEPRYQEQIFHMFERLHTHKEYEGTGVGLAICKKIVERHGGRNWVDSEPGKGSTFYFTIPSAA